MTNVMLAARQATADTFSVVSKTTSLIARSVNSADLLMSAAESHADRYARTTIRENNLSVDEFEAIAIRRAKKRIASANLEIDLELESDPRLQAAYDAITFTA